MDVLQEWQVFLSCAGLSLLLEVLSEWVASENSLFTNTLKWYWHWYEATAVHSLHTVLKSSPGHHNQTTKLPNYFPNHVNCPCPWKRLKMDMFCTIATSNKTTNDFEMVKFYFKHFFVLLTCNQNTSHISSCQKKWCIYYIYNDGLIVKPEQKHMVSWWKFTTSPTLLSLKFLQSKA